MQMISQYPSYDKENFHKVFMRDLYCKLNKQCFAIVTKKLKDLPVATEAKNCSWRDFKRWIEESKYQENLLTFSGNKQSSTKEKHHNHSYKDQKSFQNNSRNNNRQRDYNGASEQKQESQKKIIL